MTKTNTLYDEHSNILCYGDNLDILQRLSEEHPQGIIDLIYIDPPFNSNRNYNILFQDMLRSEENGKKHTALKEAFKDTWSNVEISKELEALKLLKNRKLYKFMESNRDIFTKAQMSYLTMMAIRLYYMHKVLKDTGSFYLHCDPTMSHYLKLLCDVVFGENRFRNEIAWCYTGPSGAKKTFPKKKDYILWYSKSDKWTFNDSDIRIPYSHSFMKRRTYPEGKEESKGITADYNQTGRTTSEVTQLYGEGKCPSDWWIDIPSGGQISKKERLGYPTQKPEALLERIIKASSKQGDLVADFFCGCGTTVTVASRLERRWIGVDISHLAIGLIEEKRLVPQKVPYEVRGFPADRSAAEKLAREKHFEFERWVVEYKLNGHATPKTGDGGYDGHIACQLGKQAKVFLLEVKGGKGSMIASLRSLAEVVEREGADGGIFICFDRQITSGMKELADAKGLLQEEGWAFPVPRLSVLAVEALLVPRREYPDWLRSLVINTTYF